jgi:hypothetical protein
MAKYRFEIMKGRHGIAGVTYEAGTSNRFIDTDVDLAASLGGHRFRLVEADTNKEPVNPVITKDPTVKPEAVAEVQAAAERATNAAGVDLGPQAPTDGKGPHALGEDVTEVFEDEAGDLLKVFKKDKKYYVVRADDDDVPLHGKGTATPQDHFTSRKEVQTFIEAYKRT